MDHLKLELMIRATFRRIGEVRKLCGVDVDRLASDSGVAANRIMAFESIGDGGLLDTKTSSHRRAPTAIELMKLAQRLGVSEGFFLAGESSPEEPLPPTSVSDEDQGGALPPAMGFNSLEEFRDSSPEAPSDSRFWRTQGLRWEAAPGPSKKEMILAEVSQRAGISEAEAIRRMREELRFVTRS